MITQAICWTLLHSLWQGALAALFAGIIILCTRKSRAAVRYNLLVGVLALFLTGIGVTFCVLVMPAGAAGVGVSGVSGDSGVSTNEIFIHLLPEAAVGQSKGSV